MFDKILEKAEEAMTKLSKLLTVFEQDSGRLKAKAEEQLSDYHRRIDEDLRKLNVLSDEKINEKRKELEGILFEKKLELSSLLDQHRDHLKGVIEKDLSDFSKAVKGRFESLYAEYEVQAVDRAQKAFESDISEMFNKYGDKIAPCIFKSLLKYILRFGRK